MIKQIKSSIHNFIRGCKGGRGSATESRSWFMVKKYLFHISLYYLCWVTLIGVAKIKANVLVCGGLGHSGVWDCMSGEIQWNHYSSCKHPGETLNKVATWSYDKSAEVLSLRLFLMTDTKEALSFPWWYKDRWWWQL